jgi:hypothetical protein
LVSHLLSAAPASRGLNIHAASINPRIPAMKITDRDMAAIIAWLQRKGYTAHVTLAGRITLRDKVTGRIVYQEKSNAY